MNKRSYNTENRTIQASQTKSKILQAAKELFKKEGFEKVTISKLAKSAEVSMPTIYAVFKSKRGVLQALLDEALPPKKFWALVDKTSKESSPKERLNLTAKIAREIYDAEKELMDVLSAASVVAPEFKELEIEREKRRYDRQGDTVKQLQKENVLAKELTLTKARDILWMLTGRDTYRLLVIERKWSSKEYETWLSKTLISSLLDVSR